MKPKYPEDITFQVTVNQLTLSSTLTKQDIRVTVCVDDVSKMTCSGNISKDGQMVTWNHPFLFTAPPSITAKVAIWILPELTLDWNKQPFGDQMVTDVAGLLKPGNRWQCNVPGLSANPGTLSITCNVSDVLIMPNDHDCLSALGAYSIKLDQFGRQLKNVALVTAQIELDLARLDLCPLEHASHNAIVHDVALSFSLCYDQRGNIADLNKAIEFRQTRLDLCPLGHSKHAQALGELALVLWKQYSIQKNKKDLNRIIAMAEEYLKLCPSGHPDHAIANGTLALFLWETYLGQKDVTILNRIIEMAEKGLSLCPTGHPSHGLAIQSLAVYLGARYQRQGNLVDLNRAIDLLEKDLDLRPNAPSIGNMLRNLAISLQDCYYKTRNPSDLNRAISLLNRAMNSYPVQHHKSPLIVDQLASAILLSFNSPQKSQSSGQPVHSLDEVIETYRHLRSCGPAASLDLLKAIQSWVQIAEKYNHSSVLEAYQTSLNTLDYFTSLTSSLDSRHEAMQARVANLANNAFSSAIRCGDFQLAIELLEQGRGILWNQLARFDISIAVLESQGDQGKELSRKFTRLSTALKQHAQRNEGNMDSYWRIREEWQSVVEKIRGLDGFSRFLLPPRFEHLQRAAEYGPVIIVNASEYTCDALVVLRTRSPVHVSLPCSLADVDQLCSQLSELTGDAHAYGTNRESYVKQMLRDLWSSVVEPIAAVLQNDIQLPLGSRIWWCPTSKFTILPFHAAGPHRGGQKNIYDMYISSYAPSLSTLIRTCERIRSQKAAHDVSGTANLVSFAAVGQGRPSADTKLGELPEVAHEIERIRDETGMPPDVIFETVTEGAAAIEGAVEAFRDHRWVHIACHGSQHATKPFDSWFAMGDGKLTLMRIIQERYTGSEFAFLSACHTAVGDASTPDEVLHLAAGMQFAGFNGVIGTLWRVDDAVAHQMVTRFYREMFNRPIISFEHAAEALNTAVVDTAGEVSLEKRIVFVHIGV